MLFGISIPLINYNVWYFGTNGGNAYEYSTYITTVNVPGNGDVTNGYPLPFQVLVGIGTAGFISQDIDGIPISNALSHSSLYIGEVILIPITIEKLTSL